MKLTLKEIAQKIDGRVIGDETLEISGVSSFYDASVEEITFASDLKFLKKLHTTRAGAAIVPEDFDEADYFSAGRPEDGVPDGSPEPPASVTLSSKYHLALIKTKNPKGKFFRILAIFHPPKVPLKTVAHGSITGSNFVSGYDLTIDHHVTIGDNVKIGDRVHIMHGVYIGDGATIGDDTVIKPNVTIMERTRVGARVIIHSGTVIGSDGFGFTQEIAEEIPPCHTGADEKASHADINDVKKIQSEGSTEASQPDGEKKIPRAGGHKKIPHAGFVHIDDDVEIGACNTIDRGTFGRTWIGRGVKTDNLVHIAHNVTIGDHALIVAQVGIAGSTIIGKRVILAGKAGISGHLTVGDGAIVGPGAGILSDVKPGEIVSGIPGMPHKLWLKVASILPTLPAIRKRLLSLERKLER